MDNVDQKVETNEEPQMKVMGNAAGSRTTVGGQEPNTFLASRADEASRVDQSLGQMGNAAGFPNGRGASSGQQTQGDNTMPDLMGMIQRYPLPSLLVGIGLGYLLSSRRAWR